MTRYIRIEEVRKISRQSRLLLYGRESTPAPSDFTNNNQNNSIKSSVSVPIDKKTYSDNLRPESEFGYEEQVRISKPLQNALKIIQAQIKYKLPFLFRREALQLCDIRGGATIIQAEKEALRQGLIIKHTLPRGKTNVCFWEITDKAYEQLKLVRPVWRSKGKYKHKFSVHRIEHQYQNHGYNTKIEARRPNGKLVDLQANKAEHVLYIEVCTSWPIEKELTNIQKNLDGDPKPNEIILAIANRKMRKPLEQALDDLNTQKELSRPVKVVLAGNMINFLEIKK